MQLFLMFAVIIMFILAWIIALCVSFFVGFVIYKSDKKKAVPYPIVTAALRSLVVFSTFLLLLSPYFSLKKTIEQLPTIVLLQDESSSIPTAIQNDTLNYRKNINKLMEQLSTKYRVVKCGFGSNFQTDSLFSYKQSTTNISDALNEVQTRYGSQNLGAVILASDGRYNQGEHPLFQNNTLNTTIYTVAMGDSILQKDIRITQVYHNKSIAKGNSFELKMNVIAEKCENSKPNIKIFEEGKIIKSENFSIANNRFDHGFDFTITPEGKGLHHYVVLIDGVENEINKINNRKDVFVDVIDEKKKILIIYGAPHPDINALKEALSTNENYAIDTKSENQVTANISGYQALILHNVSKLELQNLPIPTWHIMGIINTPNPKLNAVINNNPDNYFAVQSGFSLFSIPKKTAVVLDKMPPLVSNYIFQNSTVYTALFTHKNNLNQKLWSFKQAAVPTAYLWGEGLWRWRMFEYRYFHEHQTIDECIRQTVSFLASSINQNPLEVDLPKTVWNDVEPIEMNAYLRNANHENINQPDLILNITDSAKNNKKLSFEKSGSAYHINLGLLANGSYNYIATTQFNGKTLTASGKFLVNMIPLEQLTYGADYSLLNGIAQKYKGQLFSYKYLNTIYDTLMKNKNLHTQLLTQEETLPIINYKWFFFIILLLAGIEWLLRKYWLV